MRLTTTEARQKVCPFKILALAGGGIGLLAIGISAIGDATNSSGVANCIASDCPLWRWIAADIHGLDIPPGDRAEGFCGLGGHPV